MLTLFATVALLLPQWGDQPRLQPFEVRSDSEAWTLEVAPSDPNGEGPMRVRLLHEGEVSWSGDFAWTFEAAGLSDDGTIVGYGNGGNLRIAVLGAKGMLRRQHEIEHTASVMHGTDLPKAIGPVLVHPTADLALIRVLPADQSRPSPWQAFHLSTGEAAPDVRPALPLRLTQRQSVYERDARVIGDTQLTLAHWWFADYGPADLGWPQEGGVFALHDLQGEIVWALTLLDDYTDRASEKEDDELEREVKRAGVIVSTGPGNTFALHHVREKARVEYAVEKDEDNTDGWIVREVARQPWDTAEPAPEAVSVETLELVPLGTVSLRSGAGGPEHPIHRVRALGFTDQGEIELVREEESGPSYARLRPDGELLFERDLTSALPAPDVRPQFHDLAGDDWLLQFLGHEPPWVVFDVRTGEATLAPLPAAGLGCHVAPFADGGYLALLDRIVRSLAFTELYYVGADGTVLWQHKVTGIGPEQTRFDRAVYFGQGLARTGPTTFTLLGMSELTRIDLAKNVLASWELETVLGHRARYMTGLLSDAKGGVLFKEGDTFQQVDFHGTRSGSFVPRRADGSRDTVMDHLLAVAPDGRLWTSDRQRVYRLDAGGVVDLVLGPEAKEDELVESAGRAEFDALGRTLVQDRVSRSVHVFDTEGRRLAVCRLEPGERPARTTRWPFRGLSDGSVLVSSSVGPLRFDASGTRVSKPEPTENELNESSDPALGVLNALQQRPDGRWLGSRVERALLPDGRCVVLEAPEEQGEFASLHLYTADGEPLHTIEIPSKRRWLQLTVSARWIVIGGYGPSWTLVRIADEKLFRFDCGLAGPNNWKIGQTPDGGVLLLLDQHRLELARFELP